MITKAGNTKTRLQSYRDLQVWRKSMDLTLAVYRFTQRFPREEAFGLTSQLRRCSMSIPSNIAEGHGRMNVREFKRFLLIARGSNCELQTQLELSSALGMGSAEQLKAAQNLSNEVERMLMALLTKVKEKCG